MNVAATARVVFDFTRWGAGRPVVVSRCIPLITTALCAACGRVGALSLHERRVVHTLVEARQGLAVGEACDPADPGVEELVDKELDLQRATMARFFGVEELVDKELDRQRATTARFLEALASHAAGARSTAAWGYECHDVYPRY